LKFIIPFLLIITLLVSCTKEVTIDIPQNEEKIVVEGRIYTDQFPVVLLSRTQYIYAPTDLSSYLNSFITDAEVFMTVDSDSVQLFPMNMSDLPSESLYRVCEILEVKPEEAIFLPIKVYSTLDSNFVGKLGKKHRLSIRHQGRSIYGETSLLNPIALSNVYWKPSIENSEYGTSVANFTDPTSMNDAYFWEVKRIHLYQGEPIDKYFKRPGGGYIRDKYWNGMYRTLDYDNPLKRRDTTHLEEFKRYYRKFDSVVIRFSKIEYQIYEFFRTRREQMDNQGSPFASPINVKSNLKGPAVGIWAGFSPYYDTLVCVP
jgi:hypothetical protein